MLEAKRRVAWNMAPADQASGLVRCNTYGRGEGRVRVWGEGRGGCGVRGGEGVGRRDAHLLPV